MRVAVTGSIATDHLMTFRGRFADSLVVDQLDKISVSFLAESLEIRRGGVAPNICFAMAALGQRPLLVGAAGQDFGDYRSWLTRHGVDCTHVHISEERHTARFVCTTDDDMAQMATFYAGAMSDARNIELGPVAGEEGLDLVLIGANDPDAMLRHTEECRDRGYTFVADPSQQLAFAEGPFIRQLIDGADYLFTNEYESHLTEQKTGWDAEEVGRRVTTRVITQGKDGALVMAKGQDPVHVPVAGDVERVDPTGVGDAFRGGFLSGLAAGLTSQRCAEIGSVVAAHVLETVGTQEYVLGRAAFLDRLARAYGDDAAADVAEHLTFGHP
ncbi:MAG TPA: carbohydrate kinase family protein [Dermatophilaceae bacterium]|nr:carbohydrate kinase family protein [Dermatophilaceae bacterium]